MIFSFCESGYGRRSNVERQNHSQRATLHYITTPTTRQQWQRHRLVHMNCCYKYVPAMTKTMASAVCRRSPFPPPPSLFGGRVLLRKLWAKMSEPDWRTVSKAVFLFHSILKDLPVEHHAILKIFLGKVSYSSTLS